MASEPAGRWGEYHVIRLPDGTEIRFPEPLHDRVREGVARRRRRVEWGEGKGDAATAVAEAATALRERCYARPTILSMTDADYRAFLKEPSVALLMDIFRVTTLDRFYDLWIERRADDDLPGVAWVEIVTTDTP